MREVMQCKCFRCSKDFEPTKGTEYFIKGERLNVVCPSCIDNELSWWQLRNIKFYRDSMQNLCSFENTRGAEIEFAFNLVNDEVAFMDRAGLIQSPKVYKHIKDQLTKSYKEYKAEKDKWKAKIRFVETFDESYVEVNSEATGELRIRYKEKDGELILDPMVKLDKQIKEQLQRAWAK